MKNIFLLNAILLIATCSQAQNTWTQKASFGGGPRSWSASFSIGDKGYVGIGFGYYNDFWEYDPQSDAWTQKANFGGPARGFGIGFNIGSKGYIGMGSSFDTSYHAYKDFWEYDPALNTWIEKAEFGGPERFGAVGFSINGKGYVGIGGDGYGNYLKDFWEYDPITDSWNQKEDFVAAGRAHPVDFSIGNKGYVATGYAGYPDYAYKKDLWEYDPDLNDWTQKADFPGTPRDGGIGFSLGNKGYMGTGYLYDGSEHYYNDFWEYDPVSNSWVQKADFGGSGRIGASGFSIGNNGYLGTGISADSNGIYSYSDFWEFGSKLNGISIPHNSECQILSFPNPSDGVSILDLTTNNNLYGDAKIEILNLMGQIMHSQNAIIINGKLQEEIQLSNTANGMYLVKVIIGERAYTTPINVQK